MSSNNLRRYLAGRLSSQLYFSSFSSWIRIFERTWLLLDKTNQMGRRSSPNAFNIFRTVVGWSWFWEVNGLSRSLLFVFQWMPRTPMTGSLSAWCFGIYFLNWYSIDEDSDSLSNCWKFLQRRCRRWLRIQYHWHQSLWCRRKYREHFDWRIHSQNIFSRDAEVLLPEGKDQQLCRKLLCKIETFVSWNHQLVYVAL